MNIYTYKDIAVMNEGTRNALIESLKKSAPEFLVSSELDSFYADISANSTERAVDYATIAGYVNAFEIFEHVETDPRNAHKMLKELIENDPELVNSPYKEGRHLSGYNLDPIIKSKYLDFFQLDIADVLFERLIHNQPNYENNLDSFAKKCNELEDTIKKYEEMGELYLEPQTPPASQPNDN